MNKKELWNEVVRETRTKALFELPEKIKNFLIGCELIDVDEKQLILLYQNKQFVFNKHGKGYSILSAYFVEYGTTFMKLFPIFDLFYEKFKKDLC
jgi:uncharacterized protein YozE (UPF0346 family)